MLKQKKVIRKIIIIITAIYFIFNNNCELRSKVVFAEFKERVPSKIDGVKISEIKSGRLNGYIYEPEKVKKEGIVIIVSGSDGTYDIDKARNLSTRGYKVACLAYFNKPNLPKEPILAPVDIIDDFLKYCKSNNIDYHNNLSIIGTSLGTVFCQIAASNYSEVKNIILYSPCQYALPITEGGKTVSTFSFRGKSINYINPKLIDPNLLESINDAKKNKKNYKLRPYYEMLINNKTEESKPIDLSGYKGKILIFAGTDDQVAPSEIWAKEIYERNMDKTELNIYEGVGHAFTKNTVINGMVMGGNPKNNIDAFYDSNAKLINFLNSNIRDIR